MNKEKKPYQGQSNLIAYTIPKEKYKNEFKIYKKKSSIDGKIFEENQVIIYKCFSLINTNLMGHKDIQNFGNQK